MKDTAISYDLVHQQQQQQQQQQQHQQQQQQHQHHHSWNQQRQQQHQAHTTSVYANQSSQQSLSASQSQRSALGHQQQQQNQHAAAQLGQYHHQQLQSTAHHNTAAAYYQQAHLYPTYQAHAHSQQDQQQQPQHSTSDHQHGQQQQHHHHPGSTVPSTATTASVVNPVAVAAAQQQQQQQQQHAAVHHQQAATNTQGPALNHASWPPGVSSMPAQPHHAVVTDHSTLAYMTHAYQSHTTSVNDHHRNSNGPLSTQPIGTGPQASSYAVDTLYNTPAAVAAYGYNNYNAAFFQTSNNGPHNQTGHPSGNLSTFWNHNQATQQRTAHSQPVSNQASVQQRQPIASEQAANYMHDPRIYYGRPTYDQGMQNFGQAQHHSQTQQPQADVLHHRMTALSQQHQLLQHHEQQLHQVAHQQQHLHQQSTLNNQHQSSTNQNSQTLLNQQQQQLPVSQNQLTSNQSTVPPAHNQSGRQISSLGKTSPQNQIQKQLSSETDGSSKSTSQVKSPIDSYDIIKASSNLTPQQPTQLAAQQVQQQSANNKEVGSSINQNSQVTNLAKEPVQVQQPQQQQQKSLSSISPVNKPTSAQAVIKTDSSSQYQRKTQVTPLSQLQNRFVYRGSQQEERGKPRALDTNAKKPANEKELRSTTSVDSTSSTTRQQNSDQSPTIEESMATLSVGASRKTTWASIASQPAKVSQPKSLKSKIAGSNSVLSSAKHLAAVSLDTSSLESKNGINPAIKSSVSAAATSIQRSSVPPPVTKIPPTSATSLKLDLLGEESIESSRISWPVVNAAVNLTLDDPPLKDSNTSNSNMNSNYNSNEKQKKDDNYRPRDFRDSLYKDHNHNQGSNAKMVNSYQSSHSSNRDFWNNREQRGDYRIRRDSDRKEQDHEKQSVEHQDDSRDPINPRRDFKPSANRTNHFRGDEQYRDRDFNKQRGVMQDRNDQRNNDGYQNSRFPAMRYDSRDSHNQHNNQPPPQPHGNRHNENQHTQHHHYNNVRDGNTAANSLTKLDLSLHPHLDPTNFNPKTFNLEPENARYFIIKSYSEDDIHRSIKYSIWCSTNHGNKRLDEAYRQQQSKHGPIYLFFSVNGSGHFCGMAQMMSSVDFDSSSGVWAQSKWQGEFSVKWIYVKDVPNSALRHITLENNEDKPVTNSRDTQEVLSEKGKTVLKILHQYSHTTSIFDDFLHYERRQEEEKFKKSHFDQQPSNRSEERDRGNTGVNARFGRPYMNTRSHNDFQGNRERPSRFAS